MREILHDFTSATKYDIVGYDGVSTPAAGQGTAHIRNSTTGHIEKMFFVYVPSIRGTIVSLEHHARAHPNIHRWTQEATPQSNTGWVTFLDAHDQVVSRYQTLQEQGLYYIQGLHFECVLPAPPSTSSCPTSDSLYSFQTAQLLFAAVDDDDATLKTTTRRVLDHIDFDHQLQEDNKDFNCARPRRPAILLLPRSFAPMMLSP